MAINDQKFTCFSKLQVTIIGNIERFFYGYGLAIARNPWRFILACCLLAAVSTVGLVRFRQERNPLNLWTPPKSDFKLDTQWIMDSFQEGFRSQYLLIKAPNVLEPSVLLQLEKIRKRIVTQNVKNMTYEEACFRIPAVKPGTIGLMDIFGRRKRSFFFFGRDDSGNVANLGYDPSLYLSTGSYCAIVNKLPKVCLEMNLPQMWSNDDLELQSLTLSDVIEKLNTTTHSPVTGHSIAFPELLGGVVRDDNGRIISASSLLSIWMTHVNFSEVDMDAAGNDAGTSDWATVPILDWEEGFINALQDEKRTLNDSSISIFFEAGRSFADISGKAMFQDMEKLIIGCILMFLYLQFILPARINRVEMRFWLGCVGLLCILIAFAMAVGLCSLFGIPYGPVHTSLPFLLLGIGVDDVFVITTCWRNLTPSEKQLRHDQQVATALRHAGVSITVTSMTDFVAFLVGSFTILPCLQSFCLYAAAGLIFMFFLQATVFVAFLSLDSKRIAEGRNCVFWCLESSTKPKETSHEGSRQSRFLRSLYDKVILRKPVKILLLMFTFGITAFAVRGNMHLKQRFEPEWFLPDNSYLLQFMKQRRILYPDLGMDGALFIGETNYSKDFPAIHQLAVQFESETPILKTVDSWTHGFIKYSQKAEQIDVLTNNMTDEKFQQLLSSYLWSPSGARFQKNFRFNETLVCGKPAPVVLMSSVDFIFRRFPGPEVYIPAMNKLKALARESNLPRATVWAKIFANWVTDEVIDHELYRNLAMAMICVMLCTMILIVDLRVTFLIFTCVLLTVVNVAGFMYYWGLYIDITSCIALVLAVGLCVDYASHIGHTFLRLTGSRHDRAVKTVEYIGTASLNGVISTLLALSLLGFSDAYIFSTFFKIFLLVILFGMFHGIVFLPVVLSILGPPSYNVAVVETPIPLEMQTIGDSVNQPLNGNLDITDDLKM